MILIKAEKSFIFDKNKIAFYNRGTLSGCELLGCNGTKLKVEDTDRVNN